ncbi:sodium-potassium-chloride cotransporter, partial [Reticulomyxa filosa]
IAPLITQVCVCVCAFVCVDMFVMSIPSHSIPNAMELPTHKYSLFGDICIYFDSVQHTALIGGLLCVVIMLATRLDYAVVAIIIGASIYGYVSYSKPNVNWGSAFESRDKWKVWGHYLLFFCCVGDLANRAVLQLMHYKVHVKNFQPSFLVLCGNPENCIPLVKFVYTLQRGHGMLIYANVITGDFTQHIDELSQYTSYLPEQMKMQAFFENVTAPTIRKGAHLLFQLAGLGKLRGNILVLGFKNQWHQHTPNKLVSDSNNKSGSSEEHTRSNDDEFPEDDTQSQEKKSLLDSTNQSNAFSNDDYVALLMDAL